MNSASRVRHMYIYIVKIKIKCNVFGGCVMGLPAYITTGADPEFYKRGRRGGE